MLYADNPGERDRVKQPLVRVFLKGRLAVPVVTEQWHSYCGEAAACSA